MKCYRIEDMKPIGGGVNGKDVWSKEAWMEACKEIRAFVASVQIGSECFPIESDAESEELMREWKKDGVELPEGLLPYILTEVWNEMLEV